jgi:hypothetical protein
MKGANMHNRKTISNRSTGIRTWRLTQEYGAILMTLSLFNLLGTTAYIVGQFEFKQSILVLNKDGCAHLTQRSLSPLSQTSDTCRIQANFRSNLLDAGGRAILDGREVRIPEYQLIAAMPLEEQPWSRRHWLLLGWDAFCAMLLLGTIWVNTRFSRKEGR